MKKSVGRYLESMTIEMVVALGFQRNEWVTMITLNLENGTGCYKLTRNDDKNILSGGL